MADIHQTLKLNLVAASTQYSIVLPATTRRVRVTPRGNQPVYCDFTTGIVAAAGGKVARKTSPFDTGDRVPQATTIYVASPTAGSQVIVEHWG